MESRRVWLAIRGLSIDAWPQASFASIVNVWGKFVGVDDVNLAPTSFERGYVLIETNCVGQINDRIDIKVEDLVYRIFVTESDWNGPMVECECGSDESSRSASHVSNTYAMDISIQKVAQEIVSGQDLGRRLGDVNAPDLIDQVSNSGDLNLNMQRGNKAESGDVVEEVRSLSPSSLLVCSIPDTGTIELGQDYHTSLVNLSNIAERNSSERVTSSLADLGVIQVSLGTDGIVASKRGRGRPRKGSGVSGLVDAKKSLQYCHSQDSLRLRRIKHGCGLVG
ncbi:hypothetical protein V6N13_050373 [Hibiscus sabdariffa]